MSVTKENTPQYSSPRGVRYVFNGPHSSYSTHTYTNPKTGSSVSHASSTTNPLNKVRHDAYLLSLFEPFVQASSLYLVLGEMVVHKKDSSNEVQFGQLIEEMKRAVNKFETMVTDIKKVNVAREINRSWVLKADEFKDLTQFRCMTGFDGTVSINDWAGSSLDVLKEVALAGYEFNSSAPVVEADDGFFSADDFKEMAQFAEASYQDCLDNNREIGWTKVS